MKKMLKGTMALGLFALCCSAAPSKHYATLAGLIIDSENDNYIYIRAYYSSNLTNPTAAYSFTYYYQIGEGNLIQRGYKICSGISEGPNQKAIISDKIDKSDIAKNCHLVTKLNDFMDEPEMFSIRYDSAGSKIVYFSEENNATGVTSGYIKESKSPFDDEFNYCYEDRITFSNFENLHIKKVYNDYDISYLRFKYTNGLDDKLKGTFRFAFLDKYNNFNDYPFIDKDSMYRYINLTTNLDENGEYYFTFADDLYYDPDTHESAPFYKQGYIKAKTLFFPKNKAEELSYIPSYIEMNINGFTDFKAIGSFEIAYNHKYFGDCEDSEYCIYIVDDDSYSVREKVVEVEL